jgi:HEAT repeat protein
VANGILRSFSSRTRRRVLAVVSCMLLGIGILGAGCDKRESADLEVTRLVLVITDENTESVPGVRDAALDSVMAFGPAAVDPLLHLLTSSDPDLARNTAHILGKLCEQQAVRDGRIVPALSALLRSPDRRTRFTAAWALGAVCDPAAIPSLTDALADTVDAVRRVVGEALVNIGPVAGRSLLDGLPSLLDPNARYVAASVIERTASARGADVFERAKSVGDVAVVAGAYRYYLRSLDPRTVELLSAGLERHGDLPMAFAFTESSDSTLRALGRTRLAAFGL